MNAEEKNPLKTRGMGKLVTATVVGNTIEFYDFNVYGTLTALVFGTLFFPTENPFISTMLAFGTFAVGFISRPVGGMIFGALGDRLGRKPMLMWSLAIMGSATFLMGCLPTYAQIGVAAPLILLVLRFVQGFGIGGEWGGAVTLMIEHSPKNRRGFFGSLVQTGSGFGIILASGTMVTLLGLLTEEQLMSWGWRIPFIISVVLVLIGAYIRIHIEESPEFSDLKQNNTSNDKPKSKLLETMSAHWHIVLAAIGMYASVAAVGFLCGVFVVNYVVSAIGFTREVSVTGNLIGVIGYLLLIPIGGICSDRFGRVRCYIIGAASMIIGVGILFALLNTGSVAAYYIGMFIAEATNGFIYGIQAAMFASLFPPEIRYTGISLGMQIGTVLGGGLMPTMGALLVHVGGGSPIYVIAYITALCLVTIVCTYYVYRKFGAGKTLHF